MLEKEKEEKMKNKGAKRMRKARTMIREMVADIRVQCCLLLLL